MWLSDLKGKAVLVTGSSTGIGAAAASAFAAHGCRVAVHCNSSRDKAEAVAAAIRDEGGEAVLVTGDVTRPDVPKRIVAEVVDAFGRLDVLVNNAGGLVARTKIESYDDAYLDAILALNVKQVAAFVREAVAVMRVHGGGSIINVGSSAARHGGGAGSAIYAATKGFVSSATRGWAKELAADGIRVNAVSPGVIMTPFQERFGSPAALEASRATILLRRIGSADECAGAMLFLASEKMSSFVTGQVIEVNGGQVMP